MILSKSRLCESERPLIWRMCTPMAIKMSALLGALAILSLPVVSCGGCPATPSVTSLSPSSATAGAAGFSLTVNGNDFSSNAVVVYVYNPTGGTQTVGSSQVTASNTNSCSAAGSNAESFTVSP